MFLIEGSVELAVALIIFGVLYTGYKFIIEPLIYERIMSNIPEKDESITEIQEKLNDRLSKKQILNKKKELLNTTVNVTEEVTAVKKNVEDLETKLQNIEKEN